MADKKPVFSLTDATFNFDMNGILADYKLKNPTPSEHKIKVGGYSASITVRVSVQSSAQWLLACGLWTWREYIEFVYPQARQSKNN